MADPFPPQEQVSVPKTGRWYGESYVFEEALEPTDGRYTFSFPSRILYLLGAQIGGVFVRPADVTVASDGSSITFGAGITPPDKPVTAWFYRRSKA